MALDPQARAILEAMPAELPDLSAVPPALMREAFQSVGPPMPVEQVARVEDRKIPGPAGPLPARVYAGAEAGPQPLLVYFHGGGFVIGNLDTHDNVARGLANAAGCTVVSIDYRLAPEARFPAAPDDCFAATAWVAEHAAELGGDASRLAVAGDSAGANLATVVALMARERGGPALACQVLVYPVTDHGFDTPSYRENADGYLLTRDLMRWYWGHYLEREGDGADWRASPLRAADLGGLPPALVITAEYDPLRDEGEAYARRLREAGVPTRAIRYDGVIHGFFSMFELIDKGRQALDESARTLRGAFGS